MVSALDQRPRGRGFESRWLRAVVYQPWASCFLHPGPGLTQPSILSGLVNEYRLRLGRYKAGMCNAAWCAPCTWAPLRWQCLCLGRFTSVRPLPRTPTRHDFVGGVNAPVSSCRELVANSPPAWLNLTVLTLLLRNVYVPRLVHIVHIVIRLRREVFTLAQCVVCGR